MASFYTRSGSVRQPPFYIYLCAANAEAAYARNRARVLGVMCLRTSLGANLTI